MRWFCILAAATALGELAFMTARQIKPVRLAKKRREDAEVAAETQNFFLPADPPLGQLPPLNDTPPHLSLLDKNSLLGGFELPKGIVSRGNEKGVWMWSTRVLAADVLVVIGGRTGLSAVPPLLKAGFTVWVARSPCTSTTNKRGGVDLVLGNCRENFGYLTYLADSDTERPTAASVVFIHGHTSADKETPGMLVHQRGDVVALVADAASCSAAQRRYVNVDSVAFLPFWEPALQHPRLWNAVVGDLRPVPLRTVPQHCCGQFAVPGTALDFRRPENNVTAAVVARLHTFLLNDKRSDSIFFEFMYPAVFGAPTVLARFSEDICPVGGAVADVSRRLLPVPPALSTATRGQSRLGTWVFNDAGGAAAPSTVVVIGRRSYPDGVLQALLAAGYTVYAPHRQGSSRPFCLGDGVTARSHMWLAHCENEERGYLHYLLDDDPSKPVGNTTVFVKGDTATPEGLAGLVKDVDSGAERARETNSFAYLPSATGWQRVSKSHSKKIAAEVRTRFKHFVGKAFRYHKPYNVTHGVEFAVSAAVLSQVDKRKVDLAYLFQDHAMGDPYVHAFFWKFIFGGALNA
eukprot:Rhum_TRINITY_DN20888_c0_g1::Rhum_TRINITY_DN20888_c0_g1_i1::g.172244::m.172244